MLSHYVHFTGDNVTSLAQSLFDLRQTIPGRIPLQSVVNSPTHLSERFPPHLARAARRLARLFDGGGLIGKPSRWYHTFDLFLLTSLNKTQLSRAIPPDQNRLHVTMCLGIMVDQLRFNICRFPSSFARTNNVANLEALASSNISPQLRYACRNWTRCIPLLKILDIELLDTLCEFFRTQFLHWLEVMSILRLSPLETLANMDATRVRNRCNLLTTLSLLINYP